MGDLVLWTWVVGGMPPALALIRRAVEWSLETILPPTIAQGFAAGERPASNSGLWCTHG